MEVFHTLPYYYLVLMRFTSPHCLRPPLPALATAAAASGDPICAARARHVHLDKGLRVGRMNTNRRIKICFRRAELECERVALGHFSSMGSYEMEPANKIKKKGQLDSHKCVTVNKINAPHDTFALAPNAYELCEAARRGFERHRPRVDRRRRRVAAVGRRFVFAFARCEERRLRSRGGTNKSCDRGSGSARRE